MLHCCGLKLGFAFLVERCAQIEVLSEQAHLEA